MTTHELHHGGPAYPGEVASPTHPEHPETHKNHDTTEQINRTRRLLVFGGGGLLVAGALGGGVWAALRPGNNDGRRVAAGPGRTEPSPTETLAPRGDFDQVPRVFSPENGELRREQITMPATLDPDSFEAIPGAVAQAIQYYVNFDPYNVPRVIPGTVTGTAIKPGQFEERGAFFAQYREVYKGMDTHHDDPENKEEFYAWGFTMEPLEQLTHVGGDVRGFQDVAFKVRVGLGDYRPEIDGNNREWHIEKPRTYETQAVFTRYANVATLEPMPDGGWGLYQMGFPESVPDVIRQTPPKGFETMPPLY